ncbi:MAG: ABC transporter permease [Candidatus Delongbacteria bacterium]|nr:ABC transporter permease [Candidatus Delongbacteria bacterium]
MSNLTHKIVEEEAWDTVIKPKGSLFEINFKELWAYRDLGYMFVKRDITTQYKQTILGPAWFFIQPIFTTVMYVLVFGGIAGIKTGTVPQALFYLAGISMWNYFSDCLNKTSSTFASNAHIFGKVYFPRLIVPLSVVTSNLVRFFIQLGLFICVYLFFVLFKEQDIAPNFYLLLFPVLVIMMAGIALGTGVLVSSLTTKYRDLTMFFLFFVGLWMYATPVIYPLASIPAKYQFYAALNPLTSIFEAFKYGAFGEGAFSWWQLGYSFGFMVVLLGLGIVVFNRVQRSFMDTV